jgi:hypothetical protein
MCLASSRSMRRSARSRSTTKIQRDLIARGIFESRNDLKRKIMPYIRCHNANAKPFKWTYRNAAHRITP